MPRSSFYQTNSSPTEILEATEEATAEAVAAAEAAAVSAAAAATDATSADISADAAFDSSGDASGFADAAAASAASIVDANLIHKDGSITWTANQPLGGFKFTGVGAATANGELIRYEQIMVGDSGSGGARGLVPAPATGDATKFLQGDGTWADPGTAVPGTRLVDTGAGLTGGGDLSTDRTISIDTAAVTNAMLADMSTARFKGRTTAGTGAPEDLTGSQATALLSAFTGDSGAGGVKGLVPAPAAGDAADNKFLKADGTWTGAVALIASGTASAVTELDITLPADYKSFRLVLRGIYPSVQDTVILGRVSQDSGSSYHAAANNYGWQTLFLSSAAGPSQYGQEDLSATYIALASYSFDDFSYQPSLIDIAINPGGTNKLGSCQFSASGYHSSNGPFYSAGMAYLTTNASGGGQSRWTNFRILPSTGNFTCEYELYGYP
jgi:hypothetical protein